MAPVTRRPRLSKRAWGAAYRAAACLVWVAAVAVSSSATFAQNSRAAYELRDLGAPAAVVERGSAVLDTPVLPGSVIKVATLAAALESGALDASTTRLCRRVVTVDGRTYTCSHPDLHRPLTAAEALAHSCNDFFVALAPRVSRDAINAVRTRAGLPAIAASTPLAPAIVGLDGPRVRPRLLAEAVARLVGLGLAAPVPMRGSTRQVLRDGLRGAAGYGTASAFTARGLTALAKTGTVTMPGGGTMGLVVALLPADAPTRSVVVVAPGAAGLDAAAIAADLVAAHAPAPRAPSRAGAAGDESGTLVKVDPRLSSLLRVGRTGRDGHVRATDVELDEYVAEVLAGEAEPGAGDAALRALAITVRTYALANRGRHEAEGFDLCDTTHCQVARPFTPRLRAAAAATSGQVLLKRGRLASVFHSAWCGGHPERPSEVWPGTVDDAGAVADDDACAGAPGWRAELRVTELDRALRAAGLRGGPLRDLRVTARTRSGRVARVRLDGWSPSELSGQEFRTLVGRTLGWQFVKSTAFDLTRTSQGYLVTGTGFGHGAGLCVLGAGRRAMRGESTEAILQFYFPALAVGRMPTSAAGAREAVASSPRETRPGSRSNSAARRDTAPLSDIALALPAAEVHEREELVTLIRRARDRIASMAAVEAPALRVTVHPTVESFGRATGQSWLVAGATSGHAIDLLPVATLRRAGRLERVVTHEVAHAVVDEALARRALWVREGAAAYFASGVRAATPGIEARSAEGRTSERRIAEEPGGRCPADSELRRPASAAALADAYARAEACFRRGLARVRTWRDVA
jgi:SpoIID/LytB domain protein